MQQYAGGEGQHGSLFPLYSTDMKMSTVPFNHLASNHLVIIPLQRLAEAVGKKEGKQQRERKKERQNVTKAINGEIERRGEGIRGVRNSLRLVAEACMSLTADNKPRWQLFLR